MSEEQLPSAISKREMPTGVKVLLRILSILLCLCLCVSLLATVLILDFRLITHKDTIRKMAGSIFSPSVQAVVTMPMRAAVGSAAASGPSETTEQTQDALVAWLYDTLKQQHGDALMVTQEQMQSFLNQSTTKEYLTDKIASYADDFINGTNNTTITSEELTWLIEENNAAIEAELGVKMDAAAQEQVLSFVEEMNIGQVIRNEVIEGVENLTIPGGSPLFPQNGPAGSDPQNSALGGSYTIGALMADLRTLTSNTALIITIIINLFLITALFFVNRMRLSATLCCAGIPAAVLGVLLSLANAALQLISGALGNFGSVISVIAGVVAPVHYGMLGFGVVLLIAAIVVKVLRKKAVASAHS